MDVDRPQPAQAAPLGDKANQAARVLGEILERMGVTARVEAREEGDNVALAVEATAGAEEVGLRRGDHGPVVEALQVVVNRAVNRSGEGKKFITVDVGTFRQADDPEIAAMALRLADKAKALGKPVAVGPMNPRERRLVHLALAGVSGIATRSEGEGAGRRLLIVPAARPAP